MTGVVGSRLDRFGRYALLGRSLIARHPPSYRPSKMVRRQFVYQVTGAGGDKRDLTRKHVLCCILARYRDEIRRGDARRGEGRLRATGRSARKDAGGVNCLGVSDVP